MAQTHYPASVDEGAAQRAAEIFGVDAIQLGKVEVHEKSFEALGLTVTCIKTVRLDTHEILMSVRDASGRSYDLSALRQAEVAAMQSQPALKIDRPLRDALAVAPTGKHPVCVWLHLDTTPIEAYSRSVMEERRGISLEANRLLEQQIAQFAMARVSEVNLPFEARMRGEGLSASFVSTTAPLILADLEGSAIEGLSRNPLVDRIYLQDNHGKLDNLAAMQTHRTDRVHEYGVTGRGVRVAVHEPGGIDPVNPFLNVAQWFNPAVPSIGNHAQAVGGCIASQLSSRLGSSPDVELLNANSASFLSVDLMAALDWVAVRDVDITNMSWGACVTGAISNFSRYVDFQSRVYSDSYVASSGNDGPTAFVNCPSIAWNVISVGAVAAQADSNWTGDVMAGYSSYGNPNNGCEKPNVVAVGSSIDTLSGSANNWLANGINGTSFSSPLAAANLANALTANVEMSSPEVAMAAMMTTAWHNIEGDPVSSDLDGAGCIHGLALYRCAKDNRARFQSIDASSFSNNGYFTYSIDLRAYDRARIGIAWSSQTNATYSTDTLDADLDVAILLGTGVTAGPVLASSSSMNNNFEIVEFTPTVTGSYTIRVQNTRFDGTSENLGIAWTQKYADTHHARLRVFTDEVGTSVGGVIGNTYYAMDVDAPGSPNAPFLAYPSATPGLGVSFGPEVFLPMSFDIWSDLWWATLNQPGSLWSNPFGVTTADGQNSAFYFNVPFLPPAIGYDLHTTFWTGEVGAGYPSDFKEISEVQTMTFLPQGTTRTMADDSTFTLALPFSFEFYGVSYTQAYVSSNGCISFGIPNSDLSESQSEMLSGPPRIAACWDDLEPNQDGSQGTPEIRVTEVGTGPNPRVIIYFANVGEFQSGAQANGANTFRYTLFADGRIDIEYRDLSVQDGLVGISPGNGLSAEPPIDFTNHGNFVSSEAIYEVFNGSTNSFDLAGPSGGYLDRLSFIPESGTTTSYRIDQFDTRY